MITTNTPYVQQIAELLEELNILINANITSGQSTTVEIKDLVTHQPNIITIVEYESFPKPPATVSQAIQYITPPPIVKRITIKDAYLMNCGSWNPSDPRYVKCMGCVDEWISQHPEVNPVRANGCGCKVEKEKCFNTNQNWNRLLCTKRM
jgi:hypothetical protein